MNMAFLDNLKNIFNKKESSQANPIEQDIQGSQRSLSEASIARMNYDLEIQDRPIRDPKIAQALLQMGKYCDQVKSSVGFAMEDCFLNYDGSNQGWTIAPTLEDEETPVNPDLLAIALDLKNRMQDSDEYVIGGDRLETAGKRFLIHGDSFLELGIEKDGISRNYCITRTLYLPTWDCFRIETDKGELKGFEQRKYLTPSSTESIFFPPEKIIHFRRDRETLYGTSWFQASIPKWEALKESMQMLRIAQNQALAPTVHSLPSEWEGAKGVEYKKRIDDKRFGNAVILDYFVYGNIKDPVTIERLKGDFPNLADHIDTVYFWQRQMIPDGVPDYYFGTARSGSPKQLSGEPAKRYARMRSKWCSILSKGIEKAINLELRLVKGDDWFYENAHNKYRIIWPDWAIDSQGNAIEENTKNPKGMKDLDD